jgi:two-component system, OmpR family, phosphate regulon sensor histidine kinase PhoR
MAEMAEVERFFAESATLIEMINAGDSGLAALQHLVELAQQTVGGVGASFAEYGAGGGRVIAASGASTWAIGRRVDPGDPVIAELLERGRLVEIDVDALPGDLRMHLRGRGAIRMLGVRAELTGQLMGSLHVYFAERGTAPPHQRAALSFFAALAVHLYEDSRGLPLYGESPAAASLADALAVIGQDGTVRSWNPAAALLTGYPAAGMVDRPFPLPIPRQGQVGEHRLADGRWIQLIVTELPASDARVITLREVTEAHRRAQARDLFATVTSHELRTPVTVIKGYADTLADHWDLLDEGARRDAAVRLRQRATGLARLVERLLAAVGDGSAPASTQVPVPFDLAETLRAAVADLPAAARAAVQMRLPDQLPKVVGERAGVATALSELVTNAVKYSPPGSPVEVTAEAEARSVAFRVADRGIGVLAEHVERAFDRFWQAESGDHRRYGGVGLGLYLVRQIIERQNGWVSLRPREGGGTVAEVRLRRADVGPGEA